MKVLIVEDSKVTRRLLVGQCKRVAPNWEVTESGSVDEAIAAFDRVSPELALCDLQLEDRDGLEVIRHIRDSGKPCKIVVLTGKTAEEAQSEALASGAEMFLTKPPTADKLVEVVKRIG